MGLMLRHPQKTDHEWHQKHSTTYTGKPSLHPSDGTNQDGDRNDPLQTLTHLAIWKDDSIPLQVSQFTNVQIYVRGASQGPHGDKIVEHQHKAPKPVDVYYLTT